MGGGVATHGATARRTAGRPGVRRRPRHRRRRVRERRRAEGDGGDVRRRRAGRGTINAFARIAGATVHAVDVGIGHPTADIRTDAALTPERFDAVTATAIAAVDALDTDLLVLGEIGVGNTTAAAAIAAALAGGEAAAWVGRGTGVDDAGLARKRRAVQEAVRRIAGVTDPLEVLREVGGAELVAVAAAVAAARQRSLPVVLDGYVVSAAVLPLVLVAPAGPGPLHRRPLLDRTGSPPAARAARPATAARPRHAPRRGQRGDGRRAAGGHGLCRRQRRAHLSPSGSAARAPTTPGERIARPRCS